MDSLLVQFVRLNCASRPIAQGYTNLQEYLVLRLGNLSDWCMNCNIRNPLIGRKARFMPVAMNYDFICSEAPLLSDRLSIQLF